jgi:hypothetical protein
VISSLLASRLISSANFFSSSRLGARPLRNPGSSASAARVSSEPAIFSSTASAGISISIFLRLGPSSVMVTLLGLSVAVAMV